MCVVKKARIEIDTIEIITEKRYRYAWRCLAAKIHDIRKHNCTDETHFKWMKRNQTLRT